VTKPTLLCLVGPTAGGKTRMGIDVALALRQAGHAPEIVSCDSMGVYRGLDIVADKPSADEQRGIPHHLFDVVDPSHAFTAVQYRDKARAAIDDIAARGGVPLLVGGSGLYFRAVVDELSFAPTNVALRERLEGEDPAELWERLREADPEMADMLDPRNTRRVVRAVEILELTGRPPSAQRNTWERGGGPYDPIVAGLTWSRKVLLSRAAERVQRELDAGLVDEVRRLDTATLSKTAFQALGVKEIVPFINGEISLEDAQKVLVRNTKAFVRRQLSWFTPDPRVEWFDASAIGWDGAQRAITARFAAELRR
jgi:tRNA dimethylallyltransferase